MAKDKPLNNIVLTGFMGTGKSTIGALLAQRLGYEFIDTDALIETRYGHISEIFANYGQERFREIERAIVNELAERTGLVIATGGGLILDKANAKQLAKTAEIFCLSTDIDELTQRLKHSADQQQRPLISEPNMTSKIELLLAERAESYARFEQVDTTARTPIDVVDHLMDILVPK